MSVPSRSDEGLAELVMLSRRYGADPRFVVAGGGNTSYKTADRLWVKASGHALATIGPEGLVCLSRGRLAEVLSSAWPDSSKKRESIFQERVMAARIELVGGRPSVEVLLHHLIPGTFVVHTHSTVANAVTCCKDGEAIARQLFGDDVLWQAYVDPGLVLAQSLRDRLAAYLVRSNGRPPAAVLLADHGLIVAGDTAAEVDARTARVVDRIAARLAALPADDVPPPLNPATLARAAAAQGTAPHVVTDASADVAWLVGTTAGRAAWQAGPLTPDQIVYCRSWPMWVDDASAVPAARAAYVDRFGVEPWAALVAGGGLLAFGPSANMAEACRAVFAQAATVYRNATRLGGVAGMPAGARSFIETWEVEVYRRSVSAGA